jgi:hypothetical protein
LGAPVLYYYYYFNQKKKEKRKKKKEKRLRFLRVNLQTFYALFYLLPFLATA